MEDDMAVDSAKHHDDGTLDQKFDRAA